MGDIGHTRVGGTAQRRDLRVVNLLARTQQLDYLKDDLFHKELLYRRRDCETLRPSAVTHFVPVTLCITQKAYVNLRLDGVIHNVTGTKCVTKDQSLNTSCSSTLSRCRPYSAALMAARSSS